MGIIPARDAGPAELDTIAHLCGEQPGTVEGYVLVIALADGQQRIVTNACCCSHAVALARDVLSVADQQSVPCRSAG